MTSIQRGRISPTDLKKYPQPVIDLICEAINEHGVPFRVLDGGHLMLYSGDRSDPPFKIAAVRPHQATLRRMIPWLEANTSWQRPGPIQTSVPQVSQSVTITRTT